MIQCPKCKQNLESQIKEIPFEFTQLALCGFCGFGFDLRWHGRVISDDPTPDLIFVGVQENTIETLKLKSPGHLRMITVPKHTDALSIYAKALRKGEEKKIKGIILQQRSIYSSWTEVYLAIHALEKAFEVQMPMAVWIFAPHSENAQEIQLLEKLAPPTLYWCPCEYGDEDRQMLTHLPEFILSLG